MADASEADIKTGLTVVTLPPNMAALGAVLDLLVQSQPFSDYGAARLVSTVKPQLARGLNFAALKPDGTLVGYAGLAPTTAFSAELWLDNKGPLQVVGGGAHDALAATIVVSLEREATMAMWRAARKAHAGMRVFFRRGYEGGLRQGRKSTVTARG